MYRVLVCDDDKEIVEAIGIYLAGEGYEVIKAYDGMDAMEKMKNEEIHLIIMDIMMPNMNGIVATMKIREKSNIPVIMLSAKSEDNDKILGLNIGADDYVTKPFNPLELIARVKSQIRRYTMLSNQDAAPAQTNTILKNGGIMLNDDLKEVTVDGDEVKLTPIEYNILKFFMENPDKVFTTSQIYEQIWQEEAVGVDNIVAVHIRHIREKIEINPKEPRYLMVVWGQGYKMQSF